MIKAEVIFDESEIHVNGFIIQESSSGDAWYIVNDDHDVIETFFELEQAIRYCLEQSQ